MIFSAKYASLLAGIFQQSFLILILRYSKSRSGPLYLNSVAVASAEVFKLCLSFTLEYITTRAATKKEGLTAVKHLSNMARPMIVCSRQQFPESIKLIVPAILYLIQNNLTFVALANLSVGMYQVTNQGKLLTTALMSRIMLQKRMSGMQYASVALLGFGVAFIHLSDHFAKGGDDDAATPAAVEEEEEATNNQLLGLIAVIIGCFTSAFSGVYFEWVLKKSTNQLSVHCRNFHLASWSLCFAIIHILFHDRKKVFEFGLFHGFDILVVLVVVSQGMTGFVVSMMIKYADNVLKGFSISLAAVLSTLLSVPLFGANITPSFGIGAGMVVIAVKGYSKFPPPKEVEVPPPAEEETMVQIRAGDEEAQKLIANEGGTPSKDEGKR